MIIYLLLLVAGLAFAFAAAHRIRKTLTFLRTAQRSTATVVGFETVKDSEGDLYAPLFRFYTPDNREVTYRYPVSSSPKSWSVGAEITVVYDLQRPEEVRLLTFSRNFGAAATLLTIAAPLVVVPLCYFLLLPYLR